MEIVLTRFVSILSPSSCDYVSMARYSRVELRVFNRQMLPRKCLPKLHMLLFILVLPSFTVSPSVPWAIQKHNHRSGEYPYCRNILRVQSYDITSSRFIAPNQTFQLSCPLQLKRFTLMETRLHLPYHVSLRTFAMQTLMSKSLSPTLFHILKIIGVTWSTIVRSVAQTGCFVRGALGKRFMLSLSI
jgi:hypothetical protein